MPPQTDIQVHQGGVPGIFNGRSEERARLSHTLASFESSVQRVADNSIRVLHLLDVRNRLGTLVTILKRFLTFEKSGRLVEGERALNRIGQLAERFQACLCFFFNTLTHVFNVVEGSHRQLLV